MTRLLCCIIHFLCLPQLLSASDWTMFRGPDHNGISTETGWKKTWGESGPGKIWEAEVGIGFSSVSIADGRVFTLGNQGKKDTLFAFDASTGKKLWKYSYDSKLGAKF